jgi:septum formation protein
MEESQNNQICEIEDLDLVGERLNAVPSLDLPPLVLASASPRRAEILQTVGWPFEAWAVDIDESRACDEAASNYVERLAREKAEAATARVPNRIVLGADTVVVVESAIFGKPTDADDAREMLRALNGRWHDVLTGIALRRGGESPQSVVAHEMTQVRFAKMSEDEINWYVATGEPLDKAGAYAIQGRGARFIERIKGDYFNVVGLPVRLLYKLVQQL